MTFLIRPGAPLHAAQLQARALATWRDAELRVQRRWDDLPRGGPRVAPWRVRCLRRRARRRGRGRAAGDLADTHSDLAAAA